MNFKKWKLGLILAIGSGLLSAGAGLVGDMGWKSFVAVLCVSLLTNLGNFLKQHPVEDISDTEFSSREGRVAIAAVKDTAEKLEAMEKKREDGSAISEFIILMAIVWAMLAIIFLFSGCAIGGGGEVFSQITTTNGVVEMKRAHMNRFLAVGDARNVMASQKISNTKTGNSIGQSGLEQETTATNAAAIIGSAGELIGKAAKSFITP